MSSATDRGNVVNLTDDSPSNSSDFLYELVNDFASHAQEAKRHEHYLSTYEEQFLQVEAIPAFRQGRTQSRVVHLAQRLLRMRVEQMRQREDLLTEILTHDQEVMPPAGITKRNEIEHPELKCCICLEIIAEKDKVCRLPCMHVLHSSCVLPYLRSMDSPMCPIDRIHIPPSDIPLLPVFKWER